MAAAAARMSTWSRRDLPDVTECGRLSAPACAEPRVKSRREASRDEGKDSDVCLSWCDAGCRRHRDPQRPRRRMIVVPDYRDHRIEVNAVAVDGGGTRRCGSGARCRGRSRTSCYKLTAEPAERAGEIWARAASCQPSRRGLWSNGSRRGNRVTLQDVPMTNSAPLKLPDLTGLRHGSTAMTTTEITR
jgi:hypothetical protein